MMFFPLKKTYYLRIIWALRRLGEFWYRPNADFGVSKKKKPYETPVKLKANVNDTVLNKHNSYSTLFTFVLKVKKRKQRKSYKLFHLVLTLEYY